MINWQLFQMGLREAEEIQEREVNEQREGNVGVVRLCDSQSTAVSNDGA